MIEKALKFIVQNSLIHKGDRVLAAFSGGADSTALVVMLNELSRTLGFELAAAHFNHGIRGESADGDQDFCRSLCERLEIPFFTEKGDVPAFAKERDLSIETAARLLRYRFLYKVCAEFKADSIATAHHSEDNAESILMHILRGSGLAGICGMKSRNERPVIPIEMLFDEAGSYKARTEKAGSGCEALRSLKEKNEAKIASAAVIRPLLGFKKAELIAFLLDRGVPWQTDDTNFTGDTARNLLRLNIMPRIVQGINKNAVNNIIRLGEIASEDEAYLDSLARSALDGARAGGGYSVKALYTLPPPIKKRAVRLALFENGVLVDAEQKHIEGICALLCKQSGAALDLPSFVRARIDFDKLVIERRENERQMREKAKNGGETAVFSLKMEEGVQHTPLGGFKLSFISASSMEKADDMMYNSRIKSGPGTALMDLDRLRGELCVRTRREGDRFHPVNSEWRMKLKDFFISRRVDKEKRNGIPLLICGDEIVFIPGFVVSDEVKLTNATKRILRVDYISANDINKI